MDENSWRNQSWTRDFFSSPTPARAYQVAQIAVGLQAAALEVLDPEANGSQKKLKKNGFREYHLTDREHPLTER